MSTSNPLNQFIILNDGRKFGFAEWGDLKGNPVLLFVGGSSRIVRPPVDLPNLRLITVDRPGIGFSDFHPKRKLLNLPDDILQLIDYLDIKQIAVVGMSQGGPSALACAYKIPNRLVSASVVSSLAPLPASQSQKLSPVASFSWLANNFPFALKIQSTLGAWMVALNPSWTFQQVLKSLPQSDRRATGLSSLGF
jgi:pimeloyl-ACP methyl ester carboxylesterase